MINSFKYLVILLLILGFTNYSWGQSQKNELSISAGGGSSSLNYSLGSRDVGNGLGGQFGLRYAYYIKPSWSIGIGAEYQTVESSATFSRLVGAFNATDIDGDDFEFRYTAKGFRESQSASFVNIPMTLQFETKGDTRFYVAIGAKVGIPIIADYTTEADNLQTSGFYEQFNVELFNPAFAGFGDFGSIKVMDQDWEIKTAYSATLELGIKHVFNTQSFYLGASLDYGLNDIYDGTTSDQTIQYNANVPATFTYNTLLGNSEVDKVNVRSFGLKMRYAFGF